MNTKEGYLFSGKVLLPSGQNRQKQQSEGVSALKIQCHIVKTTLLQAAFSLILLTGLSDPIKKSHLQFIALLL